MAATVETRPLFRLLLLLTALFALTACNAQPYEQRDGVWHFEEEAMALQPGESLKPLNRRFAKSATRVFHRSTPIPGADAASFEALDENYARDARRAYYAQTIRRASEYYLAPHSQVRPLDLVNPRALKTLGQGYARDERVVLHAGETFPVRDARTFEVLDDGFARDRITGYFQQKPVPGSDGASFAVVNGDYAKDARRVFYAEGAGGAPVFTVAAGADPGTFEGLGGAYGRDARGVWFEGRPVEGADPASFERVEPANDVADARDRNGAFRLGKRTVAGPPAPAKAAS